MSTETCYEILGITRDSTLEEIKKAFNAKALLHHPDKRGDPEEFKKLEPARDEAIKNLKKRKQSNVPSFNKPEKKVKTKAQTKVQTEEPSDSSFKQYLTYNDWIKRFIDFLASHIRENADRCCNFTDFDGRDGKNIFCKIISFEYCYFEKIYNALFTYNNSHHSSQLGFNAIFQEYNPFYLLLLSNQKQSPAYIDPDLVKKYSLLVTAVNSIAKSDQLFLDAIYMVIKQPRNPVLNFRQARTFLATFERYGHSTELTSLIQKARQLVNNLEEASELKKAKPVAEAKSNQAFFASSQPTSSSTSSSSSVSSSHSTGFEGLSSMPASFSTGPLLTNLQTTPSTSNPFNVDINSLLGHLHSWAQFLLTSDKQPTLEEQLMLLQYSNLCSGNFSFLQTSQPGQNPHENIPLQTNTLYSGLNQYQREACEKLQDKGLKPEDFSNQNWFNSPEHIKALIYLMTYTDTSTPSQAIPSLKKNPEQIAFLSQKYDEKFTEKSFGPGS